MPRSITYGDLESGACRDYWKRGRLTWTQAKLLKKGDWLVVNAGRGYAGGPWILGKFYSRTRYNGGDAVYVSTHPEDMPSVTPFYMHSCRLPTNEDLENVYRWGQPLDEHSKEWILKRRELVPDEQISLF